MVRRRLQHGGWVVMTTIRKPDGKKERVQHYVSHQDWHASNTLKMPKNRLGKRLETGILEKKSKMRGR